jgi:uncharacterized protein (DUF2235 family)
VQLSFHGHSIGGCVAMCKALAADRLASPQPETIRQLRLYTRGDAGPVKTPEVCDQGQRAWFQGGNRAVGKALRIEINRRQGGQHRGGMAGLNDSRRSVNDETRANTFGARRFEASHCCQRSVNCPPDCSSATGAF